MSVWAVSSGSYSSYHVEMICPNEEIAIACAARINGYQENGEAFVEEFDENDDPERIKFNIVHHVQITCYDGKEPREWHMTHVDWRLDTQPDVRPPYVHAYNPREYGSQRAGWSVSASSHDEAEAWKMVRERVAQLQAEQEGL